MKVELAVEKRGASVEFRAGIVQTPTHQAALETQGMGPCDVVALPAVFQAHPVDRHVRPSPLVSIPLEDAKRLARQILGMGD